MDKAKRMKALEGYRDFLDVYLNRPMNAQEQQIFDDCADCKISFEAYKDKLIELTMEGPNPTCNINYYCKNISFEKADSHKKNPAQSCAGMRRFSLLMHHIWNECDD